MKNRRKKKDYLSQFIGSGDHFTIKKSNRAKLVVAGTVVTSTSLNGKIYRNTIEVSVDLEYFVTRWGEWHKEGDSKLTQGIGLKCVKSEIVEIPNN